MHAIHPTTWHIRAVCASIHWSQLTCPLWPVCFGPPETNFSKIFNWDLRSIMPDRPLGVPVGVLTLLVTQAEERTLPLMARWCPSGNRGPARVTLSLGPFGCA